MKRSDYRERFYGAYSKVWDSWSSERRAEDYERWGRACLWRIRGWLPESKDASILDVGCGTGNVLRVLRKIGYRNVEGVDASPEHVELAARSGCVVHRSDAMAFLRARPGQYELIAAFDLLEHLTKREAIEFVEAACEALKDGALLLQLPNTAAPAGLATFSGDLTHEQMYSPESLTQLLTSCGFDAPEVREVGPVPGSIIGYLRIGVWSLFKLNYILGDLAETGRRRTAYTRVMLARARKAQVR
jgi:SAM-dependent methyltransferase